MDEQPEKVNEKIKNFFTKIKMFHVILIGAFFLLLIKLSSEEGTSKYSFVIIIILIGIILNLYFKRDTPERRLLSEYEVKQKAQGRIKQMILSGEGFSQDSKVEVMPHCKLRYQDDLEDGSNDARSWDVGIVEYVGGTNYKKEYVMSFHPYTGALTSLVYCPSGYTGAETKDSIIIPVAGFKAPTEPRTENL